MRKIIIIQIKAKGLKTKSLRVQIINFIHFSEFSFNFTYKKFTNLLCKTGYLISIKTLIRQDIRQSSKLCNDQVDSCRLFLCFVGRL